MSKTDPGAVGGVNWAPDGLWPACLWHLLFYARARSPGQGPRCTVPYISVKTPMNKLTFLKISTL